MASAMVSVQRISERSIRSLTRFLRLMREKVSSMLATLGVEGKEERMPSELSGGQRKRVGLARALMLDPQIIIYDEPTSGLDPLTTRTVDEMIEQARRQFGVTNVVISHDMASTFRIAHRVHVLVKGKIVASGPPEELARSTLPEVHEFIEAAGIDPEILRKGRGK